MRPVSLFLVLSALTACSGTTTDSDTTTGDTGGPTDATDTPAKTDTDTDTPTPTGDTGKKQKKTITGADAILRGQLIVSEIHNAPLAVGEGVGEWFELHNTSKVKLNLNGLVVFDGGAEYFGVYDDVTIDPGGYAVFARSGDQSINGGIVADYIYGAAMNLDEADTINVGNASGTLDGVRWTTEWEQQTGVAMSLSSDAYTPKDNDVAENWCLARGIFGRGDRGSPGFPNPSCDVKKKKPTGMTGDTGIEPSPAESILPGDLVITEVMQNPVFVDDTVGEWFEIHNTTAKDIDIRGLIITDNASDSFSVPWDPAKKAPVTVPAGGYYVFGVNADSSTNGGVTVDYEYFRVNFILSNGPDEISLENSAGVIDAIAYDNAKVSWPDPAGASMNLTSSILDATDNDDGSNWCVSTTPIDAKTAKSDLGTPGAANEACVP